MVVKFQTSNKSNGNKGSCSALANYLEKEDLQKEKEAFEKGELPMPRTGFFSHKNDKLSKSDVIESIDKNKKGLGKNDAKFYAINIAPSEKEQKHILKLITNKEINSIDELNTSQLKAYENELKDYSRKIMNEYAAHYKRDNLSNGNQLLYFGKVEHERHYKGTDNDVRNNKAEANKKKPGLNSHIHIIVSRKDKEMKIKLSPLANDKGKSKACITNGKKTQRGFDRNLFNSLPKKNKREKSIEQQKLIDRYNFRNDYTNTDKELSQNITKEKSNNKELSL